MLGREYSWTLYNMLLGGLSTLIGCYRRKNAEQCLINAAGVVHASFGQLEGPTLLIALCIYVTIPSDIA